MPTRYDPNILQQYADALYDRAKGIIVVTALQYGVVFWVVAYIFVRVMPRQNLPDANGLLLILGVIGCGIGASVGRTKAFNLKLEAQRILSLREIELNTRKPS